MFLTVNYEKGQNIIFPLKENAFFFVLLFITLKNLTERIISNLPFFLLSYFFSRHPQGSYDKFDKLN